MTNLRTDISGVFAEMISKIILIIYIFFKAKKMEHIYNNLYYEKKKSVKQTRTNRPYLDKGFIKIQIKLK